MARISVADFPYDGRRRSEAEKAVTPDGSQIKCGQSSLPSPFTQPTNPGRLFFVILQTQGSGCSAVLSRCSLDHTYSIHRARHRHSREVTVHTTVSFPIVFPPLVFEDRNSSGLRIILYLCILVLSDPNLGSFKRTNKRRRLVPPRQRGRNDEGPGHATSGDSLSPTPIPAFGGPTSAFSRMSLPLGGVLLR